MYFSDIVVHISPYLSTVFHQTPELLFLCLPFHIAGYCKVIFTLVTGVKLLSGVGPLVNYHNKKHFQFQYLGAGEFKPFATFKIDRNQPERQGTRIKELFKNMLHV